MNSNVILSAIFQTNSRRRDILEILFRNGWDYMRRLLTGRKVNEPELPPPTILRNVLVELGPVYVKLGQLLSTRPDLLPSSYIEALTSLQAEVPPVPWPEVEGVIRQQLQRPLEEVFASIEPEPVAAGSIAQTHRAILRDDCPVAVKVQRPGLEELVRQDILLLQGLAVLVSQTEFGQSYNVIALAEEFAVALRAELDFTQEATFTTQLKQNLATSRLFEPEQILVPEIYWDLTSDRLLVMEWLEGGPLLQATFNNPLYAGNSDTERRAIATLLLRAFFQQICIDGFFHADPHPGNLFYLADHRLALLDCGMVGRLDPRTRELLVELLLAIASLDPQRCSRLALQLAPTPRSVNLAQLQADFERLLRQYYSLTLSEINFSHLFYEVLQASRKNKIQIPGNLGLCAKAIANLEGVGRQLDPQFNFIEEIRPLMTDIFRRQLLGEAPLPTMLRSLLDLKNLSLQAPQQVEQLLDRVTSETLQWNLTLRELDSLRRSLDDSANRLSFSIVVGSLIIGAATVFSNSQSSQLFWVSSGLFVAASLIGLWLMVSILRSGRLR
ncbi:ABC transporter [Leptolyngbya sp. 'hensonii']|uniref:ABC1 kinase family protein n=1 Tax=Leptolyngbya sp. 'hensonii' TaxID=1922337 RepID=UPI00094FE50F|nr:AarF/ABC1/UbiB kinase family protein [Leptolyngbya sp. 'hensonii']OLP18499.1 ABC transporter [Leptolyngbya sp. 'hensonii']